MNLTLQITDKQIIALNDTLKIPRSEYIEAINGQEAGWGILVMTVREILGMSLMEDDVVDPDFEDEDGGDDVEYTTAN